MVQTADSRQGEYFTRLSRTRLNRSVCGRLLVQSDVGSVLMVVGHVLTANPPQMLLVQRDDGIQHLAAAAAHPAFRYSVLPRASDARADGLNLARLQERQHIAAELGVTVEQR